MTAESKFDYFFDEICAIWGALQHPNRIIPFCTPLIMHPKFLVIGTNHSDNFDPHVESENKRIADDFSKTIPKEEHTFIDHNHPFAQGLRSIETEIQKSYPKFKVTRDWVGTNRCAIQTDSSGLKSVTEYDKYEDCQEKMDVLLREFISFCKPKNVILTGLHACKLYYSERTLADMKCKRILLSNDPDAISNLIPIWHVSELWRQGNRKTKESFKDLTLKRLKHAIRDGFCEL